ncbi:pilus assembly protein TadG-related protein [Thioclava sp. F28-4]|uniref:pilus assembly protein TadG-related protein n=1 Tax=Thioclava sp. F28-4 TaxID=1915315 RepID=UPI000996EE73|nr:pilus assembly protein TadG-related protein [Thioclava sp. F28-4]OOY06276.1 hypothetical protein BMI87_01865 [Thioclava sp. F28-4]
MGRIQNSIRRFAREEDGTILVFFGASLVVVLGLVALSFDLGRLGSTRSELQSFADSVALAAAGELDGNSDAITRANAAAQLIVDSQTFATGSQVLGAANDVTLTYLSALPDSDSDATNAVTTDPAKAAFVRVDVDEREVPGVFAAAFTTMGGYDAFDGSATAQAVAGLEILACDVTPLMFCVPPGFDAEKDIGQMILLRSGGGGDAAWGPGDFGFLDPNGAKIDDEGPCAKKSGAQLDACLLGAVSKITQCFNQRGVDLEPGQKEGRNAAIFNVRFDMYQSIMNGLSNDPDYAPAPNVIKGIVAANPSGKDGTTSNGGGKNTCIKENEELSPDTVGLPRDDCFMEGAAEPCGRFGDGDWSQGRITYMQKNYGIDITAEGATDPFADAETRYDLYLAEIAAAAGGDILSGRAETGLPSCAPAAAPNADRRVLIVAGIDCSAETGTVIKGAASGVPVKEFVKVFLTEPVGEDGSSPPTMDIWGEVIGSASNGDQEELGTGGMVRDVVQLYR